MRAVAVVVTTVAMVAGAAPLQAWGLDVHRFLTRRAIEGLPPDIRPFFASDIEFIAEHSVDPDLWRTVGLSGELGPEDPNHFLDIDGLDEPRPFTGVPREWEAYVARYGAERANRMGRVPWRVEEIYGKLVTALRQAGEGRSFAGDNARYLAAVLAHYVEDAHQPFHAVVNYDGQSTNQRGIHSRFETALVMRNRWRFAIAPVTIRPVSSPREFIFQALVESESLVASVLEADRRASAGRDGFDDAYYDAFWDAAGGVAARRLGDSASGVASLIVAAWEEAGRPRLTPAPADR